MRQALYYLEEDSNSLRLDSLAKESAAKPDVLKKGPGAKIGF